jgi:biopolymer transport protein ExbD
MQLNSGTSLQSEINVTPLVDVVLVLLIIFMVVVPLLLEGYDVGMPKTSDAQGPPPTEEAQLVLTIAPETCAVIDPPAGEGLPSNCHVALSGFDIPITELPRAVSTALEGRAADQHILFLAADDRMNYEAILRIVDLARSGVDDLRIEFLTTD